MSSIELTVLYSSLRNSLTCKRKKKSNALFLSNFTYNFFKKKNEYIIIFLCGNMSHESILLYMYNLMLKEVLNTITIIISNLF